MSRDDNGVETQERLLTAATEVFAEVGYRAATLREICRRGQANIAAVNYHFRDKEHLYAAVVRQAVAAAGEGLARIDPNPADPPEEKLRHFVHGFLENLLGVDRPVLLLRLVAHEMMEPTPALDLVVDEGARPLHDILNVIVAELMGPAAEPALVRDCAGSVISQCASYQNARAVVQRLAHLDVHDPATIEHLADHVYRFSLGGIRALAKAGKAGEPGKGTRVRQEVGQRKG
ncbi:MAG: CerR family C-terminal domain-containing protein [Thermoguttaceae bacterium]